MPVIKNARRALRVSKRKTLQNIQTKKKYEIAMRTLRKKKDAKSLSAAFSEIDRAAKKDVLHKNKAARLKSALSKLLSTSK